MIGKTLADGKLGWSCCLEEHKDFGTFLNTIPVAAVDEVVETGGQEKVSCKLGAGDHALRTK